MKIISKLKDYYDSTQKYGHDSTFCYKREEINKYDDFITKVAKQRKVRWSMYDQIPDVLQIHNTIIDYSNVSLKSFQIGFCGKVYNGLRVSYKNPNYFSGYTSEDNIEYFESFCYNTDDILHFIQKYTIPKKEKKEYKLDPDYKLRSISGLANYFDNKQEKLLPMFSIYNAPIFVYDTCVFGVNKKPLFLVNTNLNKYQFYKVKDPYQAFQDIEMYISGVLGINAPYMTTIGNDSQIVKSGFDIKTSFRKTVDTRKRKQRKNK